jgi:hypothetical protein
MLRVRFKTNSPDPRPIHWPIKHPYWVTGYVDDYTIIVAYADDLDYIFENWPETMGLDYDKVDGYVFTSRFKKPDWFEENK